MIGKKKTLDTYGMNGDAFGAQPPEVGEAASV